MWLIQSPYNRILWGHDERGVIDMWRGYADDLEVPDYETKTVIGKVEYWRLLGLV